MKLVGTVVSNNQPGCQHIVETEPNVTLPVGAKLYLAEPFAALGSPFGGGFFAGEFDHGDERYALIVGGKAEGEKLGLQHDQALQFCKSLGIGGEADWSLPTRDELAMMERNLGPMRESTPELFRHGGAEAFEPRWYWSSTEHASSSFLAWLVDFFSGYQFYDTKYPSVGVRAVRRFKI